MSLQEQKNKTYWFIGPSGFRKGMNRIVKPWFQVSLHLNASICALSEQILPFITKKDGCPYLQLDKPLKLKDFFFILRDTLLEYNKTRRAVLQSPL